MFRDSLAICISLGFAVSLAAAGGDTPSLAKLSAADMVEKNVAARGGLQAWRAVQTISMVWKLAQRQSWGCSSGSGSSRGLPKDSLTWS
jgi:hypothetical protein